MNDFTSLLVGAIIGFIAGIVAMGKSCETDTALKLSNVMNASMLDCVTKQVITNIKLACVSALHDHAPQLF